jgi:site-specific recombinase XerD
LGYLRRLVDERISKRAALPKREQKVLGILSLCNMMSMPTPLTSHPSHTYAVRSIEAGVDIYTLCRLMGHSTVGTTEQYLKAYTSWAARRSAVSIMDRM